MRHGHGTTNNSAKEQARRTTQPKRDAAKQEANRQRAQRGGQPNELGITEGQNGEQGNMTDASKARGRTPVRH